MGLRRQCLALEKLGFHGIGPQYFPLIIGLVVFVLGICAGDTVAVKVRTRTLRPSSSRRFSVMVDLPFGFPKSFNAELLSGLPRNTSHGRMPLSAPLDNRGFLLIGHLVFVRVSRSETDRSRCDCRPNPVVGESAFGAATDAAASFSARPGGADPSSCGG
jgi:hypothetical protein